MLLLCKGVCYVINLQDAHDEFPAGIGSFLLTPFVDMLHYVYQYLTRHVLEITLLVKY